MWQLLSAEGPECHHVVPLLSKLTPQGELAIPSATGELVTPLLTVDHPEAVSGAMLLLRTEP